MKNISFKNSVLKWYAVLWVSLLPLVSAAQTDTLLYHNFNSQCFLPAGWQNVNIDGSCAWRCDYGGFTQNNHSSQGCSNAANDWLITPLLDFDLFIDEVLSLKIDQQYGGPGIQIKYSNNYPGSGNPSSYSWTTLGTYSGSFYGNINMSSYSAKGYIAFHYTSSGNGNNQAARFTINEVMLKGNQTLLVNTPTSSNIGTTQAVLGANVATSGGSVITGRGIVWSASPNPLNGGGGVTTVKISGTTGVFDSTITGLPSGTKIYFKGFVSDSTKTVYTNEAVFYTLSTEPSAYPTSFTATAISKNSIKLDWTQVTGAEGYLIIQRIATAPTGLPDDAEKYAAAQLIGDGEVVGLITSGATTTTTVNGLIQGTRYYYTLFPYNYNLVNNETHNYRTASPVPTANDSTWGYPPSHSSTIESVAGSGSISISSLINDLVVNDTNLGALVWRIQLRDGGPSMNDSDDLPTTVTSFTIRQGTNNTVTNWSAIIQSAGLFDDSIGALIKAATVTANSITFNGLTITAQDDNYRPISLRLSLKKIAHVDKARFHFNIDVTDVVTKTVHESSQTQQFKSFSDTTKNGIEVTATKLGFVANLAATIEAGMFITSPQIAALDTFNGLDLDFTGTVTITSVMNNLIAGPRTTNAIDGVAAFDTVRFFKAITDDTLIATTTGLQETRSNKYTVVNSKLSDISADAGFIYPKNILHLNYTDTGSITTSNSLEVFSMYLRDGSQTGDSDFEPTELTSLTFGVGNSYLLGKAALFANGSKIAEINNVTASSQFSGFNLKADDNDSVKISLRVTFKSTAIDGDRITFNVTGATVANTGSQLVNASAGAAASSVFGEDNKVDVTGSRLVFVNQPANVARGNIMYPYPTVRAEDAAGNIDVTGRGITIEVLGSALNYTAVNAVGIIPTTWVAQYTRLIFDVPNVGVKLVARAKGMDSALSNPFDVMLPVWFRSVKSGNWNDLSTWQSTTDFGTTWGTAIAVPDYSKHGYITIQSGHTVQMDGTTIEANTVDEVTVEKGAVLVTPVTGSLKLSVNGALGDDIIVEGKLLHNNSQSMGGAYFVTPASILVKKGGVIELASFGDAADWAGNPNIWFEDSATYIHNTSQPNTINAATMFPNAAANEVAIFRIAQNTNYPGSLVNPADAMHINGLLSIDSNKTFTIGGKGERHLRNGITGAGNLVIIDSAKTRITGEAQISGTGKISVNGQNAEFQVAASSRTRLVNNKEINAIHTNGIKVAGELNGLTNGFTGNATTTLENGAKIITANPQGVDGLFGNTGTKSFSSEVDYVFNGSTAQNSGAISSNAARTVWVDNTSGLTLTDKLAVTDTLFMGGTITTTTNNLLTIAPNGVISGYSASKYINGPLKMWVDNGIPALFPTGKANYAPVTYATNNTADWITLEYINDTPNANGFDTAQRGAGLAAVKAAEYWKITSTANAGGKITIPYTANSAVTGVDTLNLRVVSWDGTQWVSEGPVKRTATANFATSDKLNNHTVFTIGIDSVCAAPVAPAFTPLNVCTGNTVNLSATGNGQVYWYTGMNDEIPFAMGNTANAGVILIDTVFYAEVKNIGCFSNRVAYPVKINAIPAAPVVTGKGQLCYNETLQLTANTGGTNNWYNDVTAIVPFFTGNVLVAPNLTQGASYYVEREENGCQSPRTHVDIAVRAEVQTPYSLGAEVCAGNPAVIKATANEDIHWFANATTTIPFFTGEKYNTFSLVTDTAYYLEAFDGTCTSARMKVLVDVLSLPAAPTVSQPSICEGTSAQIITTATNGDVYWYNDFTSDIPVSMGTTFTTPLLINSRSYFARVFDGKCYSPGVSAAVSVFAVPANAAITIPALVGTNQNTTVQTNAIAQNYLWDFGADATPQTASGIGPHNVRWSTQGSKTVSLKVWNGNTAVVCSTEVVSTVTVGPGLGVEGIGTAQVTVYPNPVNSGELTIEIGSAEKAGITITDATGRMVWKGETSNRHTTVNVDEWAAGIYFINVNTGGSNQTIKIIKQ